MGFIQRIELWLRWHILRIYNVISVLIAKTKITKIGIRGVTLGYLLRSFFSDALHFKVSDPIEANGMILYHSLPDGRGRLNWCYAFDYEPETCRMARQIIKPGMAVVDAGAHIGYYTLLFARLVGDGGRVFSFEPDPGYYTLLQKNIQVNKLGSVAEACKAAVGDSEKKSNLFLGNSTGTGLFKGADNSGKIALAEVLSLDDFFAARGWPAIDLIKMDIEGSEKMALDGMQRLVEKNQRLKLIIEINPYALKIAGTSAEEVLEMLAKLRLNEVAFLGEGMPRHKIPQDAVYLADLSRKLNYINLLCQR